MSAARRGAGLAVRHRGHHGLPGRFEEDEDALALLVALERGPGDVEVGFDRLRAQDLLHHVGRLAREPERGEEPERNRLAVRDAVAGAGLERVRERVPEVEPGPPPLGLVRVGEDDAGLVGGAGADHVHLLELPDVVAGEEARLHHLGHAGAALLLGERGQDARVDADRLREVERAGEVLPVRTC